VGQVQVAFPVSVQILRQAEDQVERDVVDPSPAQRVDRGTDSRRVVGAVHPFQDLIVKRLAAERDTVDAGGVPGAGVVWSDVFGVGF
jgi:hypothetical protein